MNIFDFDDIAESKRVALMKNGLNICDLKEDAVIDYLTDNPDEGIVDDVARTIKYANFKSVGITQEHLHSFLGSVWPKSIPKRPSCPDYLAMFANSVTGGKLCDIIMQVKKLELSPEAQEDDENLVELARMKLRLIGVKPDDAGFNAKLEEFKQQPLTKADKKYLLL